MKLTITLGSLLLIGYFLISANAKNIDIPENKIVALDLDEGSKELKGLPDDLDEAKIVFLNLDSAFVEEEKPKIREEKARWAFKKIHNVNVPKSNAQLASIAPKYPFTYKIGRRSQLENYKAEGYKYVLDYVPFTEAQQGIRHTNSNYRVQFPVYIENLENGDIYLLGYVTDNFVYKYKSIFNKYFLKDVKSKFRSKL